MPLTMPKQVSAQMLSTLPSIHKLPPHANHHLHDLQTASCVYASANLTLPTPKSLSRKQGIKAGVERLGYGADSELALTHQFC